MTLEAFVLGCGGSMPLPHRHLTSVLVRREGESVLFDCGEGTQVSLRRLNLRWKGISVICISHTHADHITGLPGLLMLSSQVERTEPLVIIGPPRLREYVDASRKTLEMHINYPISIQEIEDPSKPQIVYQGEGFSIKSFPLSHTRVCVGYSLVEDPRPGVFHPELAEAHAIPRGPLWGMLQKGQEVQLDDGRVITPDQVMGPGRSGRKISFVTDSLPLESISKEVSGSDILFCEGMFDDLHTETAKEKRHMTARQAGIIARNAGGVKQLGLLHFSPRYTDRELATLLEEAQEEFPSTFLTRDRYTQTIPYQD